MSLQVGPIRYQVDTSEIEQLAKDVPKAQRAIFRAMRRPMEQSLSHLATQVRALTPVGVSGDLRRGINTQIDGVAPGLVGEVLPNVLYGDPVEFGIPAGVFPPPDALQLWVKRKLDVPDEKVEQVAFLVARKIFRKGTKPRRMFQQGLLNGFPTVERIWDKFTREAAQIAARVMDQK